MTNIERRLRKAGLGKHIDNGEIVVENSSELVIEVFDGEYKDWDATEALADKVSEATGWGGFRTAGGHWYIQKDYSSHDTFAAIRDQMGLAAY